MILQNVDAMAASLLPEARVWVRKSSEALDSEITQTMEAAFLDLSIAGVKNIDAGDALIKQAVKLYLKAQFGFSDESAKYEAAYEHVKAAMSLCSDYTTAKVAGGADGG